MSNILVMGGTTFVGSSLAKHLINSNHVVDILTRGLKPTNYSGFRNHLTCDRHDPISISETLKNKEYDYIFDISAYTKNDVEILLTTITPKQKYIFCSSGAVYAQSETLIPENYERTPNTAWGKYGLDKKEAEDYIFSLNIPYIIFRPSYIYGEDNNLYRESYFFDRLLSNKEIPMPSIKETTTQFIHIDDLVRVMESSMYIQNTQGIYNLTHPEVVNFESLIKTCGEVSNFIPLITHITDETIDSRSYFPFRDSTYKLSIDSLVNDNLYIPKITLLEGLKRTFNWYMATKPKLSDKRMTFTSI